MENIPLELILKLLIFGIEVLMFFDIRKREKTLVASLKRNDQRLKQLKDKLD